MIAFTEKPLTFRPRMVLAYTDSARAALTSRQFRRLGWEVHQVTTGPEARRLACALRPQVVVLDTDLRGESGWLTCAKLNLTGAAPRVVLVSADITPEQEAFAELVGASALIAAQAALPALIAEVREGSLSVAG